MGETQEIARHIANLSYDKIPSRNRRSMNTTRVDNETRVQTLDGCPRIPPI